MNIRERIWYSLLLLSRIIVGIFDLIAILAVGFLTTSIALFVTEGSNQSRKINLFGSEITAVTSRNLLSVSLVIVSIFILKTTSSIFLTAKLAHFLSKIEARASKHIAQEVYGKGIISAQKFSKEEVIYAIQVGSSNAFNGMLNYFASFTSELFLFILIISVFFAIDLISALAAILFFGTISIFLHLAIGRWLQSCSERVNRELIAANSIIGDFSDVLRESTLLGRNNYFFEKFYGSRKRASSSAATQFVLNGIPRHVIETSLLVAIGGFVWLESLSGDLVSSATNLGIFLAGGLRLTASLLPLQSSLLSMRYLLPAANQALSLIVRADNEESVKIFSQSTKDLYPVSNFEVVCQNLSFRYPNSNFPAVSNLDLKIPFGHQVAFIGPSGSGKSTVADLILGLLTPTSGSVSIGGIPPLELAQMAPGLISYVSQRPGMIHGTIYENITLGHHRRKIDDDKLQKAVNAADLSDFLEILPKGLETDLGKLKDSLSGGQLQRIGIARALFCDPKLLILDEATSALDGESEDKVKKVLNNLRGKVTVIIIAHRLNFVKQADSVYLVENGKVTANGSFAELERLNPTVKNLVALMSLNQDK